MNHSCVRHSCMNPSATPFLPSSIRVVVGNYYPVKTSKKDTRPGWQTRGIDGLKSESLRAYEHKQLCPIILGDVLSGVDILFPGPGVRVCSFKVIGKLGRGSHGTVWLGRSVHNHYNYLVLKVLHLSSSHMFNHELRILPKLGTDKLQVAFFSKPPSRIGPKYLCLGLRPMGATLGDWRHPGYRPPNTLRAIIDFARTLIERIMELHRLGICHGDISHTNVAFGIQPCEAFKPEALEATFRYHVKSPVDFTGIMEMTRPKPLRPPHLPAYIIQDCGVALKTDWDDMSKIDLIDFGSAFEGPLSHYMGVTEIFVPPESEKGRTKRQPCSEKTDLWSIGCVIVSGLTQCNHLFSCYEVKKKYVCGPWFSEIVGSKKNTEREVQLEIIDKSLWRNEYLCQHRYHCRAIASVVHSLVQVDPARRDPNRALELLGKLEKSQGLR